MNPILLEETAAAPHSGDVSQPSRTRIAAAAGSDRPLRLVGPPAWSGGGTLHAPAAFSPTFSTGAGGRQTWGPGGRKTRVGSTMGLPNSRVVETKCLFRRIVWRKFLQPCFCTRIDASKTASAAPVAKWCSIRSYQRSCSGGSAPASRYVVETFDRPALIPWVFPPARIPS